MRLYQSTLVALFLTSIALAAEKTQLKSSIRGEISRVVDTAHLEFEGIRNWNYELRRTGTTRIVLSMPPFDETTAVKLATFSDPFFQSISIAKKGVDDRFEITFELADSTIESFDYLTDEPSRLIIDFYKKAPEVLKAETPPQQKASKKTANAKTPNPGRKPASSEVLQVDGDAPVVDVGLDHSGAYDAGDSNFDRFRVKDYEISQDAMIAAKQNIYLPFPMLKIPVSRMDQLMADPPEYKIRPKDDQENKEARLLLVLFERKRYNMFQKTFNYFEKKYPDSDYMEILKNLVATIHLMNWRETKSAIDYDLTRGNYIELIKRYPESPLLERNNLILGYLYLEQGEALATIQHFQTFVERFPNSPDVPQALKALAEGYLLARKFDDSLKSYARIASQYPQTPDGAEAQYRLGDVDFSSANWKAAITTYRKVLKDLPKEEKNYPNARFNLAEALFWKGEYKDALNEYINFLSQFSAHPYGGFAMTRIGEIMGILGVDPRRSMGAFLESSFRYPDNAGGRIARLRMLTKQMKGMRSKELKKAQTEIEKAATEIKLDGMEEFATLIMSEAYQERGDHKESVARLISYFRDHPTLKYKEQFTARIMRNIASQMKTEVDSGHFLEALALKTKYQDTWLKVSPRLDTEYFEARSYEQAGAWDEADRIYKKTLASLENIKGTEEEKERRVSEFLPSLGTLKIRLARVAVEKRRYMDAFTDLKDADKEKLSDAEQVERAQLLAEVSEFRGDLPRAKANLSDLIKKWKGEPDLLNPALVHLAELEVKTSQYENAENHLSTVLEAKELPDALRAKAIELKGDALLGQKRAMAAIEVYQNLLEQFETKRPLGAVRYKVGQLLYDRGDIKAAEAAWGKLQGGANEIFWDLAKEKLEQLKWQDDYKKYANRIPAMKAPKSEEKKP